ncbi:unnamed protein product [Closterium sp. Naga37s-1]|nr:unnamed protein product [Closterium sp. Naga37s-1]
MSSSGRSSSSSNTVFSSDRSVASSVASCSSARALPSFPRQAAVDSAAPDSAAPDSAAPDNTAPDTVIPDTTVPGSAPAIPPWDIRASPAAGSAGVQQASGDVFIPWPAHVRAALASPQQQQQQQQQQYTLFLQQQQQGLQGGVQLEQQPDFSLFHQQQQQQQQLFAFQQQQGVRRTGDCVGTCLTSLEVLLNPFCARATHHLPLHSPAFSMASNSSAPTSNGPSPLAPWHHPQQQAQQPYHPQQQAFPPPHGLMPPPQPRPSQQQNHVSFQLPSQQQQQQQHSQQQGGGDMGMGMDMDLSIQLPARRWPPTLAAVTPGRSLTASVLGRGPTPNIRTLFNIERKALGEGQYGKVYVCTEKATGARYACKTIARSSLISVEDVEDVRMEVSVLFRLQGQPNVVRVHSTYEDRRDIHIVMELCSGGELFDEINRRCDEMTVPYSERDAAKLCKAVVRAVHSCHSSGVIHRDLKPENFLFSSPGTDAVLKAADFGMAAYFKPGEGFTRVCGSCMYMAPEVIRIWENLGKQRYGPPVDIWACGVIFYILLAGNYPFLPQGPDRSERAFRRVILQPQRLFREAVWGRISADAKSLIAAMLHPDPALRPTAQQVLEHTWIVRAPDEPLEKDVVDRFKQFLYVMRLKKVKKVALRAMVEGMSEDDIRVVQGDLGRLDPNASGVVPIEALPHALHSRGFHGPADAVASIIHSRAICLDGKVAFDYADFFVALLQLCGVEQQENLFQAFSVFDQDLSGYISEAELQRACDKYRVNRQVVEEMMAEVNRDEAGRVDYNEFVAMMRMQAGGVSRRTIERHMDNGSIKEMDHGGASGPYDGDSDDMRSDAACAAADTASVGNGGGF